MSHKSNNKNRGMISSVYRSALVCATAGVLMLVPQSVVADERTGRESRRDHISADQWHVLEVMMELDDEHWDILQRLMRLDSESLIHLEEYVEQGGVAYVTDHGEVVTAATEIDGDKASEPGVRFTQGKIDDVKAKVQQVLSKLNATFSKVGSVHTVVENIKTTLASRPDIRELVNNLQASKVGQVLDSVTDLISGFIAMIQELRDGFEAFAPERDCSKGTCADFKVQLSQMLYDVEDLWIMLQALECFDNPNAAIHPLDTKLMRTLVIDKAPPIVLFVLYKVLEPFPQWDTMIRNAGEYLPDALLTFCEADDPMAYLHRELGDSAVVSCMTANPKCCALRPEAVEKSLKAAKCCFKKAVRVFEIIESWLTDDKDITAGATVVAGVAGGTNVKNPTSGLVKTLTKIAEKLPPIMDNFLKEREQCIAYDKQVEHDLLGCNAMVEYVLTKDEGGKFEEVAELVERNIRKLEAAGKANAAAAEQLRSAIASEDFGSMCEAYSELTYNP